MLIKNAITLGKEGDFSLNISADMGHVHQILANFILNSIDAMENGGAITISAETKDCYTVLSVSDTGCGIKSEHLESIATPFFTTKNTGVGLGLSIAFQLAGLNGGKIEYESSPEKGTKASLYLMVNKILL